MRRSILTVENNKGLRYLISTILGTKHNVRTVQNSSEAMQLFSVGYEPSLAIVDVSSVESENFELMEHLCTSSMFKNVPVIVLSANRDEELKAVCLEAGATDFFTKPFDPVMLSERASQVLSENAPDITPKKRKIFNLNMF